MFLRRKFPQNRTATEATEMADICRNLRVVFNARRGAGSFDEQFGLDVAAYGSRVDAAERMKVQIRQNVERFEPRLNVVSVEEEYDESGKPFLEIICELNATGERIRVATGVGLRGLEIGPYEGEDS